MTDTISTQQPSKPSGYLPSLDGWRAVAILSVIISHDAPWSFHGHSAPRYQEFGGMVGVRLFFAISGLLITTRILEEEKLVGHFDIRRFYIRRLFRIQPAAWFYLTAIVLTMSFGLYPRQWSAVVSAFFSYINYFLPPATPSIVGHFWTLSVEEHFYILLSMILFLVKKRRLLLLSVLCVGDAWAARASYPVDHNWWSREPFTRETQWQIYMLLMAAVVAVLLQREAIRRIVQRILHPWVAVGLLLLMTLAHNFSEELLEHAPLHLRFVSRQIEFASAYFMVLLVVATMCHPASLASRFLELSPIRFIGKISYSLYLWHVIFFVTPRDVGGSPSWLLEHLGMEPIKYIAAFAAASLSYYFIEKPMIRLGHRLAPAASPGRPELVDLPVERPENVATLRN